jgi:hypothetical protein
MLHRHLEPLVRDALVESELAWFAPVLIQASAFASVVAQLVVLQAQFVAHMCIVLDFSD